jgi:hypothetical protein
LRDLTAVLALLLALFFIHGSLWRGELPEAGPRTCGSLASVLQIARADSPGSLDPHTALGISLAARPGAQLAYPPVQLLARVLPAEQAVGRAVLAHHALALIGTFLLARALGLGLGAALFAAVGFGFSGPVVARHADLPGLSTLSWLPLFLLALGFGRAPRAPSRTAALGAPVVALMLLAGAPGAALALIAGALVADARGRGLAGLAALLALGIAGAAAGWLPWLAAPPTVAAAPHDPKAHLAAYATLTVPFALGGTLALGAPDAPDLADRVRSWLGLADGPGPWYGPDTPGASILYLGLVPLALLVLLRRPGAAAGDRACRRLALAGAVLLVAGCTPLAWAPPPWAGAALVALAFALAAARALDTFDASPARDALRPPRWAAWIALVAAAVAALAAIGFPDAPRLGELVQVPGARLAAPRPAAQITGQCAFTLLLGTLLGLLIARLLARHVAQPFAPGFLGVAFALLALIDQGALFAGRAWVPRRPDQLRAGAPATVTDREMLEHMRFDLTGRILVHVTGGLPARRLAWMLAPNQGLAALLREDGGHLIDRWNVLGSDATPKAVADLFSRWPPDPAADVDGAPRVRPPGARHAHRSGDRARAAGGRGAAGDRGGEGRLPHRPARERGGRVDRAQGPHVPREAVLAGTLDGAARGRRPVDRDRGRR